MLFLKKIKTSNLLKKAMICLMMFSFASIWSQYSYAQDAFIGYNYETSTYPLAWATPNTFNLGTNKEVVITYSGGTVKTAQICSPSNNSISHYEFSGTSHLLEVEVPQHNISQFIVELTGSSNSTTANACKAGIVYSDKIPFDPTSCIGAEESSFFPASNGSWTKLILTPPVGTKSLRIYKRVFFGAGSMSTSSGSSRIQFGLNQTIRLASVAVWATALPTIQTHHITFSNISTTGMDVNLIRGNGSKVAIFAKEGVGPITNPVDNVIYTANSDWKSGSPLGSQLGTSGYYCVYNGIGNAFSLTNLKVNTKYTLQAFEYTGSLVSFKYLTSVATGNPESQQTNPLSKPTVTTNTISNILSNKALGGGFVPDSGGVTITEKGLVWSTIANPTTTVNSGKIVLGVGATSFSDFMKSLAPNTTYHVRAYAINSIGIGYGIDQVFTTTSPAPVLIAIPGSINFGENYFNSSPYTVSYTLSGSSLSPSSGSITVTAPAGFLISKSGNSGFASSTIVSYSGSQLINVPIYVQLPVTAYGTFAGNITHSGGGVAVVDADVVKLTGSINQSADELSNKGTDFWLGFGYQEKMSRVSGDAAEAKLSIYIAAGNQAANVTVDMPGISGSTFPRTINIPANSVVEVKDFPTGDPANNLNPSNLPDSRLYATGVSNRGIHVYSTNGAPVSVFMYSSVTGDSASGSMIFPTNTWNSSYNVQAFGGKSNNSNPNSFFFVIANQDNTEVEFKPTNDILNANSSSLFSENHTAANVLYAKNNTYKVTLNKGQIFNAMGFIQVDFGLDLSGTTVKTTCDKKIAVFAGNGRCLLGGTGSFCPSPSSGSDNLIQQMFPNVAWGTKYLTVPTKSMEYNIFRIYVQDPTTIVKVNGVTLAQTAPIWNATALYYNLEGNKLFKIESDKPINVTQFITSGQCATNSALTGSNGLGDPEMIILSPVQQAINNTTVYSPNFKNGNSPFASYINVVIKKEGIASFKLDNLTLNIDTGSSSFTGAQYGSSPLISMTNTFKPHPGDPAYYFAKFKVATGAKHTLTSDYPFNAIAYGLNKGESYGFNAGTAIKNLSSVKFAINPAGVDTSSTSVKVAKGNWVTLKIALPYNPFLIDNITWDPGSDARISPAGSKLGAIDTSTGKAKYDGTLDVDGRTFYIYTSPIAYQFSAEGIYKVNAIATGTFSNECGGQDVQKIAILVGADNIDFDFVTTCGDPKIAFVNKTTAMPGTTITKWAWDFGDLTTSSLKDPLPHTYNISNGYKYMVKLTTTNSVGSISSDSIQVDFSGGILTKFTKSAGTVCSGTTIFFDSAVSQITGTTSGTPSKWTWNFGEGADLVVNGVSSPIQQHVYNTPGKFPVKLTLESSSGCANTYVDTVMVGASPQAIIEAPLTGCLTDSVYYKDKSTVAIGTVNTWVWTFDDGTTSSLKNPAHKWVTAGKHKVTLRVNSSAGCASIDTAKHEINIIAKPIATFTADAPNCLGRKVVFSNSSISGTTDATLAQFIWNFGDGTPLITKTTSDTTSHVFAAAGTYKVKLVAKNNFGCLSDTLSLDVKINPVPVPDFSVLEICLPNQEEQFKATNTGAAVISSWSWDFGDGSTLTGQNLSHKFALGGEYIVKLTANTLLGCGTSVSKTIKVFTKPTAAFTVANPSGLCSISPVVITNASTVTGYGNVVKIDVFWDYQNAPTIKVTKDNPTSNEVFQNLYPNPATAATANYRILMRVYNENGCYTDVFKDIVLNAMPKAILATLPDVCEDTPPFNLSGGRDQRALPGNGVYSGDGITTSPYFSPILAKPGLHKIVYTFTSTSGCVSIAEQNITVYPAPVLNLGDKIIFIKDKEFKVLTPTIISGTVTKYTWFPSTYLDNASSPTPSCRPLDDITYTLIGETANGCKDTATVVVNLLREIVPPNTFTPNGDNFNDLWEIKYLDTYPGAFVEVFNRYGKKVFTSTESNIAWDGKLNGVDLPVGTYYYIVDPKNGSKVLSGAVTIIR